MEIPRELYIEETKLKVPIPENFNFPFKPYQIQVDFMQALFSVLENRKLGIFESPTGTGKSLSILCGSLTWLEQREQQRLLDLKHFVDNFHFQREEKLALEAVDWISSQYAFMQRKEKIMKAKREIQFLESLREQRQRSLENRSELKRKWAIVAKQNRTTVTQGSAEEKDNVLTELLLDEEFAPEADSDTEYLDEEKEEKEPEFHPYKIIFASRTHSQLSQFVSELKKTQFVSKITTAALGSRQNLCVNNEVTRLKSLSLINERCLDLQKNSKGKKTRESKKQKTCSGCPYFNHSAIEDLKNQILCESMDIEDLVAIGRKQNACPYYASRKASKDAQLVLVPYNTILHSSTREGIGLRMENAAIILDEAHNLIESISNMYSSHVTLAQLQETLKGLQTYMNRYMTRFSPTNLIRLNEITSVLESFIAFLADSSDVTPRVFFVPEFAISTGVDDFDLFQLFRYVINSKLIFKLRGYLQLQERQRRSELEATGKSLVEDHKQQASGQAVLNFFEFLKSITKTCASGRIIRDGQELKFLMLNTAEQFSGIINIARNVILAGGTMKPYEDVHDQLFFGAAERILTFSCSHVIPEDNLVCLGLSHGATVPFDFTFKKRNTTEVLQDLSLTILNISRVVPAGMVIFLPSYDYEDKFYGHLKQSGVLQKIETKKLVFREPKQLNCDKVLADYSRRIHKNTGGAILLAVVGGKLSEGINFADDLGRCVVVVGLPFPNITSVEIKQKVQFVSDKFGAEKGRQFLTNCCFKAVNQSIGRAIRHSNDYAAIVLIDGRYLSNDSQRQLPDWIQNKYVGCISLGKCIGSLGKFFRGKRS